MDYSAKLLGNYAAIAAADDVPLFTQFPISKDEQRTRRDALRFESMLHEQEKRNLSEKYMERLPTDHPLARILNSRSAAYI